MSEQPEFYKELERLLDVAANQKNSNKDMILGRFQTLINWTFQSDLETLGCLSIPNHPNRVKALKNFFEWIPLHPAIKDKYRKNKQVAATFIKHGENAHMQSNYGHAIKWFNLAILFAIPGSLEQGLAYARRSLSIDSIGYKEEAMNDVILAVSNGYPILSRSFGDLGTRQSNLREDLLAQSEDSKYHLVIKKLARMRKFYDDMFTIANPNSRVPALAQSVDLKYSKERGRHLVASRNIPLGSTVLVERPYVAVLLQGLNWDVNHCHHCLKRRMNCIPCLKCVFTQYCSQTCADEAWKTYHKYECPCLPDVHCNLTGKVRTLFQLALKVMCLLGPKALLDMYIQERDDMPKKTMEPDENQNSTRNEWIDGAEPKSGVYESDSYYAISKLRAWNAPNEVVSLILHSFIMSRTLYHNSFFSEHIHQYTLTKDNFLDFVAQKIFHHVETFKLNAITVSQIDGGLVSGLYTYFVPESSSRGTLQYDYVQRAEAVYATASLANHSCAPNLMRFFGHSFGTMAFITLREVQKGEELTVSYGPQYARMSKDELQKREGRREALEKYHGFHCTCIACNNNWPPTEELAKRPSEFCCPICAAPYEYERKVTQEFLDKCRILGDSKCPTCKRNYVRQKLVHEFDKHCEVLRNCRRLMEMNKTLEAISDVKAALKFFEESVCPPNFYCLGIGHLLFRDVVNQNILLCGSGRKLL